MAADWYLPVIGPQFRKETETVQSLKAEAGRLRKSLGYEALL
jgi:hypothetical protein